jgi:hypothetical protein
MDEAKHIGCKAWEIHCKKGIRIMELIILGEVKDSKKEIEIFSHDHDCPHGFDVILTCKELKFDDGKVMYEEGEVKTCHNVTEYHHLWESEEKGHWKDRFACESDIHCTGWVPWDIFDKFSKIEVVKAEKEHDEF